MKFTFGRPGAWKYPSASTEASSEIKTWALCNNMSMNIVMMKIMWRI
jgi:hypothetical protein